MFGTFTNPYIPYFIPYHYVLSHGAQVHWYRRQRRLDYGQQEKHDDYSDRVKSILGNEDILSDQAVKDSSIIYLHDLVRSAMNKGAGPQVFYHLCGNHETDYKLTNNQLVL